MSSLPRGMIWRMNPTDEREQCDDRCKKEKSKHDLTESFFVVAAKQKAHSNVDPSLLWYGGQACWSSVCFCAPAQTSSNLATGYRRRDGGQGVPAYRGSRWADCTQRWSRLRWHRRWWNQACSVATFSAGETKGCEYNICFFVLRASVFFFSRAFLRSTHVTFCVVNCTLMSQK